MRYTWHSGIACRHVQWKHCLHRKKEHLIFSTPKWIARVFSTLRWSVAVPLLILISNRAFLAEFGLWMTSLGIHFNAIWQFRMPSWCLPILWWILCWRFFRDFAAQKILASFSNVPQNVSYRHSKICSFLASRTIRSLPSLFLCFWSVWLAWLMEVTTVQSLRQVKKAVPFAIKNNPFAAWKKYILANFNPNFPHKFHQFSHFFSTSTSHQLLVSPFFLL